MQNRTFQTLYLHHNNMCVISYDVIYCRAFQLLIVFRKNWPGNCDVIRFLVFNLLHVHIIIYQTSPINEFYCIITWMKYLNLGLRLTIVAAIQWKLQLLSASSMMNVWSKVVSHTYCDFHHEVGVCLISKIWEEKTKSFNRIGSR